MRQQVLNEAKSVLNLWQIAIRNDMRFSHAQSNVQTVLLRCTKYYEVLLHTTNCYKSTTPYYSSTVPYYYVLQHATSQYYSVLQSPTSVLQRTTPVLVCNTKEFHCTTKNHSSTIPYYKVLQCKVLQSTSPVLHCTTKHYSSTTLYSKVLLCPSIQSNTHDWSSLHMKRHLQSAEQQQSSSNITKYWACHEKWLSSLIGVTHDTSSTMRGATWLTLQSHQILFLAPKIDFLFPKTLKRSNKAQGHQTTQC